MGEIADDMIDGTCCQECGEYIGEGDGYPRTCRACEHADDEEASRAGGSTGDRA